MSVRIIEAELPERARDQAARLIAEQSVLDVSDHPLSGGRLLLRVVVETKHTENVLDTLEKSFGSEEGFRAVVLRVEATIPRPAEAHEASGDADEPVLAKKEGKTRARISREELYARVKEGTEVSPVYLAAVALSTIVAAVGLWRSDLAVIIGAMVIAPLLGPNVALALATTLADARLSRRAMRANLVGVCLALAISLVVGSVFRIDPAVPAIASRTFVGVGDVVLALGAGAAGALAYTTGVPAALIGVMVAVALLPPTVVFGLLVASGFFELAWSTALLLLTNVICVNLAGVVTFLWQGVRPPTWWEADRARKATWRAISVWVALLIVLVALMSLVVGERSL